MTFAQELPLRRLVVIGGVPVDNLSVAETLERFETFINSRQPHQVATVNVDFIIKAQDDPELLHILQEADLLTADGMPVVWGSRLLRVPMTQRVAGADIVPLLVERGAMKGWRFYFVGAAPGVAARAAEILTSRYPELRVVGTYSPPLTTVAQMPADIVDMIREAKPDILFVAFGNPKQEKWIHMHLGSLGVPVAMGVGGTLDFITGTQQRAPKWMQMTGTEWIHRLMQDPKRMWRRYIVGMVRFTYLFCRQWGRQMQARIFNKQEQFSSCLEPVIQQSNTEGSDTLEVTLSHRCPLTVDNCETLLTQAQSMLLSEQMQGYKPIFVLPMENVKYIDAAGSGTLVQITRLARAAGGDLHIKGDNLSVRRSFKELKLEKFLTLGDSSPAAGEYYPRNFQLIETSDSEGWRVLLLPRQLDVECVEQLHQSLDVDSLNGSNLLLELSQSDYIDSAGIAWLNSISQNVRSRGGEVRIKGLNGNIQRILERSGERLDYFSRSPITVGNPGQS